MNTIKIFLSASGRIADLRKDFPVFCGQFQSTLLKVFVPTEILSENYDIQHFIGQTEAAYNPTDAGDTASLTAYLNDFVQAYADRAQAQGDVVFYIYDDTLNGTQTYYNAVYDGSAWVFTAVSHFQMGNFAGTSVKIGAILTKRNGVQYATTSYYMRYVKTLTASDGTEYALYERKLPKAFTSQVGSGQNAATLVVNVVNIDDNDVTSIVTSQTAALDVLPSTALDQDPAIEPSAMDMIVAAFDSVAADMANKQDKHDANIQFTSEKTVVGALNDLNTRAISARSDIDDNASEIAKIKDGTTKVPSAAYADEAGFATNDSAGDNIASEFSGVKSRIANLENIVGSGEDFKGTITVNYNPLDPANYSQLASDLYDLCGTPQGGYSAIVIQTISGDTDKNYKFIYTGTAWEGYEIPPIELAGNGTAGLVKGTYGIGATYNTLVDIVDGEILNIWVKVDGSYKNLVYILSVFDTKIADIISGAQVVGEADTATKDSAGNNIATLFANIINGNQQVGSSAYAAAALQATQDALGNNIVDTYLTKSAGATKSYVKDYALPKEFNNVLYLSANGFSEEIPTTPASGIQFTAAAGLGETLVGTCEYELVDLVMQLSRKNSYSARYFFKITGIVPPAGTTNYQYKVVTYAQKVGQTPVLLCSDLLPEEKLSVAWGYFKSFDFGMNFTELNNAVLDLEQGDKIIQEIYINVTANENLTVDIYSNSTYPSRMNLNTATTVVTYRVTEKGETIYVPLNIADITVGADYVYFSSDNADLIKVIENPVNASVVLNIPDLSGVAGVTDDMRIFLFVNNMYVVDLKGIEHTYTQVGDIAPFKGANGDYMLWGMIRNGNEIFLDCPKYAKISDVNSLKCVNGTATLLAASWVGTDYTLTVAELGANDSITFTPLTAADKAAADEAELWANPVTSGTSCYFTATTAPTADIELAYTITRG